MGGKPPRSLAQRRTRIVGFTSWLSRTMPLETALSRLERAGCTDVELAAMPRYLARAVSICTMLELKGLSATAVSLGVPFSFSDSRLDLHSYRKSVRDSSIKYVRKSIDFASRVGAGVVYVCSMNQGADAGRGGALRLLKQAVAECSDYAEDAAVKFAIEPFPGGLLPTIRETSEFIAKSGSRNLGILLDTGHAAIAGENLGEAFARFSEKILHVHIDNNDGVSDLHWPPQTGVLSAADLRSLLTQVALQRFGGKISIELSRSYGVMEAVIESKKFVENILKGITPQA